MEAIAASLTEAAVSGLFRSLLGLISSSHFNRFAREDKVLTELKKWEKLLLKINASLEDAEEKQTTSKSVELWLRELRDFAYDAEDVIDELSYEAHRRRMKEDLDPSFSSRTVRKFIPTCCLGFNPSTIRFSSRMVSKIENLTARLEEAVSIKNDLCLIENDRGRYGRVKENLRTSSSLVDESRVYGRETDKEAVLGMLMNGRGDIGVACIWGAPGSKILVTARNEGVASIMATCGTHHLRELTDHDCLSLFTRHALGASDFEGYPHLQTFGGSSSTNIVDINLSNCRNVTSLPALGTLPSLKKLSIEGMSGVKRLDFEFFGYGLHSSKPFPVLEVLRFKNMLNWEDWDYPNKANKEDGELPSLHELMIDNCPKLHRKLPEYLPSLVKLAIKGCPNVAYSVMSLPSLLDLSIEDCNKLVPRSMVGLTSLTTLRIKSLLDLTCLPSGFEQFPGALEHLILSQCTGLTSLWQKGKEELCCLASLERLNVESCPKLVSFPETGLWSVLRHLRLRDFPLLKDLPCWIMMHSELTGCLLEDLEIEKCPSLTCFPRGRLPPTLKMLKILDCARLSSLPEGLMQADKDRNASRLEHLEIIGCPSLARFPEGRLPTSLKMFKIFDCLELEPFSDEMLPVNASLEFIDIWKCYTLKWLPDSLNNLSCLMELKLSNCQDLKYFPETGLSLPNLRSLVINSCVSLKSLPNQMLNLTSLRYLTVCDCPIVCLPRGGLPPNLLSLEIWDCKDLKEPISNWNLHTLTSLGDLRIAGGQEMVSFPDETCLLPTTLFSIYIGELHNLESLSKGLLNLPLLEELEVVDCPRLRRILAHDSSHSLCGHRPYRLVCVGEATHPSGSILLWTTCFDGLCSLLKPWTVNLSADACLLQRKFNQPSSGTLQRFEPCSTACGTALLRFVASKARRDAACNNRLFQVQ
ncbi:hypothetical protein V6N11_024753 [Hibiscus sabdariffa]|uniref:Rx N-terminal domain-containing protein n=1 Tax=Hibiscus sabdariffa TaxID=183260 RepID=A0ABR2QND0_9ROSI